MATPEDAALELRQYGAPAADAQEFPRYFVGTAEKVCGELTVMAEALHLDELVVNTTTHSVEARHRSYTLLAQAFGLS